MCKQFYLKQQMATWK